MESVKLIRWNRLKCINGLEVYPNSSKKFQLIFSIVDYFLAKFIPSKDVSINPNSIKKILIVNGAHLGDILISTSVLAIIKDSYPNSIIGFMCGSWSQVALRNHALIEDVHIVDHYRLNRADTYFLNKFFRYFKTSIRSIIQLRKIHYDLVINLYSKPNFIPLLWCAKIPLRIGYINGGFGPLLTHGYYWESSERHISQYHMSLLDGLLNKSLEKKPLFYNCTPNPVESLDNVNLILGKQALVPFKYIVIHVGTGERKREWQISNWRALVEKLTSNNFQLVFTGMGNREFDAIKQIIRGLPNCINLCDALDWGSFWEVIKNSKLVCCVESLASHVAAAAGRPTIAIWSGLNTPQYFKPMGGQVKTLTAKMPCIGCHIGCYEMKCINDVSVDDVYQHIIEII